MQIHELNTFSGVPGELDFLPVDSGFDTSKISAAELLKRKVNNPLDINNQPTNGNAGQILRTKGDGSTEWVDEGLPTDAQTAQAVSDWLAAHPEATTTVQDGAITEPKLADSLKLKVIKDYITPQMFGAIGDGVTDDTAALREAVYYSHTNGNILFFPNDKKYYVTGALNVHNNAYYDCTLNIIGCNPTKHGEYSLSKYGGIKLADNTHLFNGVAGTLSKIYGSIRNISVVGETKDTATSIFHLCDLIGLYVYGCNMSQIGAIMRDSNTNSLTTFDSNNFLTAYYFSKFNGDINVMGFTDSVLKNNYINGGEELNDNAAFEFSYYNGSLIIGNFVDYYQVIFRPKAKGSYIDCQGCSSVGNNYQVFRYFYWFDRPDNYITSAERFTFIGDIFNWTKVSSLAKLQSFAKYTYVDRDGVTQDYPPFIFGIWRASDSIIMEDAVIQSNVDMSDIVFVGSSPVSYQQAYAKFNCNLNPIYINAITLKQGTKPIWNYGSYLINSYDIDVVLTVDTLPQFALDWSVAFPGMKVKYNNVVYTATNYWNGSTWQARWLDKFGNSPA